MPLSSFFLRHALAIVCTVLGSAILWTLLYVGLLVWALVGNEPVGSPLSYPGVLAVIFVACLVTAPTVLLPVVAITEWIAERREMSLWMQIPLSLVGLALMCLVVIGLASRIFEGMRPMDFFEYSFHLWLSLLIPLGVYWWSAHSLPLFGRIVSRARSYGN